MTRTINLRTRVVEATAEAVPEPSNAPLDAGTDLNGSERAVSPAPEIDDTRLEDVSISRHPSAEAETPEMEDQNSPTRRLGFGSTESDLVRDLVSNTDSTTMQTVVPDKSQSQSDNWISRDPIPRYYPSGRGRGGIRLRPRREPADLSNEQIETVAAAEAALTSDEQELIAHRQESEAMSKGEGNSRDKGKNRHPKDFGAIDFAPGEDDPDMQLAIYKACKEIMSKGIKKAKKRMATTDRESVVDSAPKEAERQVSIAAMGPSAAAETTPAEQARIHKRTPVIATDQSDPRVGLMPSALMHPESTIARALNNGGRAPNLIAEDGDDDGSNSSFSSSDSPSSSESTESDLTSSSSDGGGGGSSRKKRKHRKKKKSKREPRFKPKEPTDYHGDVDFRKFNRFLKESRLYLKDAGFPKKEYIMRIAPFLKARH
jgi:hypothetical protein